MAIKKKKIVNATNDSDDNIEQYTHNDKKRAYNPPVGLVTPQLDKDLPKKKYSYDPHLDPQLTWSGKKENTSFEVDTVSLHVHERIDPITIIENVMKKQKYTQHTLFHYFELPENNLPNRQAIEFYKHDQNWSNRLIAGDSLLVMNSLLQKENMSEKIQMIYIDPPYGIKYGSNFQPFVNKREVKDGKDEDLTQEPETIKAFRDTWELGIHSYLTYLYERLILVQKLLNDTGSIFVQINDENLHHVKELMDEIFDSKNFVSLITFRKKGKPLGAKNLERMSDYLIWYAKDITKLKYRGLFVEKNIQGASRWDNVDLPDGTSRKLSAVEYKNHSLLPKGSRVYSRVDLKAIASSEKQIFDVKFRGKTFKPPYGGGWLPSKDGMEHLIEVNRIDAENESLRYKLYFDDYPVAALTNLWADTSGPSEKKYAVQTMNKVIQRCMLMTTDPADIILDPTCGAGTTAYVAEQWGRRWITCDTSRVAIAIARQRLMTTIFDYFTLKHPNEGISSGFNYKVVPHITLGTIANSEPPEQEVLYDQPVIDSTKTRISGPFTVEAVPAPVVKSMDLLEENNREPEQSIVRTGESLRQQKWRDELQHTGIRGKGGQKIEFSRVEIFPGTQWLHADAETKENEPKRVVISFGSDYAPLESRQVANALEEAQNLIPKPKIVLFAAFQFDPEASKDIDEINWPGVMLLKAQMNGDLFTDDLKKKKSTNESFWLVGQPDIELKKQKDGKYVIEVRGFDYYNTKSGDMESGDSTKIAMWMLDTDYDGRSLYPRQIFFPMSGTSDGWSNLAKALKEEIDVEKIEQYRGTISLPFDLGINKKIAVKIIDDRGIESLRIIRVQ